MAKLAVLADDFTGALDTGVQFTKVGIPTLVTTTLFPEPVKTAGKAEVLVLDLETRHLTAGEAGRIISSHMEILRTAGVEYFYKKTDSAMRGNIGAELEAMCGDSESLFFVPAFPKAGRTTVAGRHYCDGVPVSQTVFGKDPFNPVIDDYIPAIIARQSTAEVVTVPQDKLPSLTGAAAKSNKIFVFDAADDGEMRQVAEKLRQIGTPRLTAGCAGMAEYLPEMLDLARKPPQSISLGGPGLVVVSGSINEMTLEQVEYARKRGFVTLELAPEQKLCDDIARSRFRGPLMEKIREIRGSGGKLILQAASGSGNIRETDALAASMKLSPSATRERVAANMGRLIGMLMEEDSAGTLAVFGGDTLISVMRTIGCDGISPVSEIESGVVLSSLTYKDRKMSLITKSGGLGNRDVIVRIEQFINNYFIEKEGQGKIYA